MSKKLIIAEKPSLARNIIAAIGASGFTKAKGYQENEDYVVTWAFGHLFTLADVEDYLNDLPADGKARWTLKNLPFYPEKFKFTLKADSKSKKPDSGIKDQYNTIRSLLKRKDISSVINAGDSDREGEIIVRIILRYSENKKPVYRLWMPDQTPKTIKEALSSPPDDSKYDNLANEGFARTFIDWLYGVNLTRYSTLRCGNLLRVGRVISPIVQAIYEREMSIRDFAPEKYYTVSSSEKTKGEVVELTSAKRFKAEDFEGAKKYSKLLNAQTATVKSATTERKTVPAGRLYSLSKLQGVLGRRFKMSPKRSLEIVQSLYEKGFVTYPRTNTEYLATAEKGKFASIIKTLAGKGYKVEFKAVKSIFDDSKIESHSAITPTYNLPGEGTLQKDELDVYNTIFNRFLAVFCSEPCVVNHSEIVISVGAVEDIKINGDVLVERGWAQYDKYDRNSKALPPLTSGDKVNISFAPEEKTTKPPDRYTTDSFYKFLKNPFRKEDATDEDEYKAVFSGVELGTEATRTSIIDNAISSGYISLKDNRFYLESPGESYVDSLKALNVLMDKNKTAELGISLKQVYRGEMTVNQSIQIVEKEITALIEGSKATYVASAGSSVGKCPKCGESIVETPMSFKCSSENCKFICWKNDKYFASLGKKLDSSTMKALLKDGSAHCVNLVGKSGVKFNATVVVDYSGVFPKYSLVFDNEKKSRGGDEKGDAKMTDMICPVCGKRLQEYSWGWGCSGYQDGCKFSFNNVIAGREMQKSVLKALLKDKKTPCLDGFKSKKGYAFSAGLVMDEKGKVVFEFPNKK